MISAINSKPGLNVAFRGHIEISGSFEVGLGGIVTVKVFEF